MQIFWSKRKRLQRKEFNSHRIGLEDQRGRNFIVKTLCIVVPVRLKNRSYICINRQLFLIPKEKPKSTILWLKCFISHFSVPRLLVRERTPSFIILTKDSPFRTTYLQRYQVERWHLWLTTVKYPLLLPVLFAPPHFPYILKETATKSE